MAHERHNITVLAPNPHVTVTVEKGALGDEIHIHPGGQGFWVARMLKHLGERPLLCAPLGGEAGQVYRGLLSQWGMDVSMVMVGSSTPVSMNDRRSGERVSVAASPAPILARHELDDIYGKFLDKSLSAEITVVTGQSDKLLPEEAFRRLGHDLEAGGVRVVADLHGPELWKFLEGGPIELLKVSDEDLEQDGLLSAKDAGLDECMRALDKLTTAGAASVVLSRQGNPALASIEGELFEARTPEFDPADFRGAGDSMTAGLAAAVYRGLGADEMLRLGCAAGAANVTRHGLGSADEELVPHLAARVAVQKLDSGR